MRSSATFVAAALVALGAGFVGGELWGAAASEGSDAEVADLARRIDVLTSAKTADAARTTALAPSRSSAAKGERQAELDRRLQAVQESIEAVKKAAAAALPGARDAATDRRQLQKVATPELLAEIDARIQRALTDPARNPMTKGDAASTLRACDVLLARELAAEDRAVALMARGRAHNVLDDRASAEAAFHEALKVVGPASALGHVAAAQLGWTASKYKDPRAAAEWFLSIAGQPDAAPRERALYRFMAGNVLAGAGDAARARELYRTVVDDFAGSDDSYARQHAESCRKALAKLDQGGGGR